jgi:stress-induced morphogen
MDFKEKVEKALRSHFQVEHLDLSDDNGITGVMVSPDFEGVERLDRHRRIDRALRDRSGKLTPREQRRVLLIAPFTPAEYGPIGPDDDEDDSGDTRSDNESCESLLDLIPKVEHLLRSRFRVYVLQLNLGNGIYGFVVSPDFEGLTSSERQDLLSRAFREKLADCERRRITLISTLTPVEYEAKLDLDRLG